MFLSKTAKLNNILFRKYYKHKHIYEIKTGNNKSKAVNSVGQCRRSRIESGAQDRFHYIGDVLFLC